MQGCNRFIGAVWFYCAFCDRHHRHPVSVDIWLLYNYLRSTTDTLEKKSKINDDDDENFDPGNDFLISSKDVASVYFILHIIEHGIVAVGDDGLGPT